MSDSYWLLPARRPDEAAIYLTQPALASVAPIRPGRVVVRHGARRVEARVVPLLEEGRRLPITTRLMEALGCRDDVPYRVGWIHGELVLGPVIGILAGPRTAGLDVSTSSLLRGFLLRYPQVGGLVYLCGADAITPESDWVEGYAWVPGESEPGPGMTACDVWQQARRLSARGQGFRQADAEPDVPHPRAARFAGMAREYLAATPGPKDTRGAWSGAVALGQGRLVAGRFPLPGALWRRSGYLGQAGWDHLIAHAGARVFNSHFFDKEEGYRLLAGAPEIRPHLPGTEPLVNQAQLFARLNRDGTAVLKQAEGNSGYGLMRIDLRRDGYLLRFREQDRAELYATRPELEQRLAPLFARSRYLVQQWIDLPEYKGRLVDFRVMLQKDGHGDWTVAGAVGRFGRAGAIVTNFVNAGYALPADEALQLALGLTARQAFSVKAGLYDFALAVGRALDHTGGCFGDLGLDIAVDRQQRFWLFEANKLPFHELPLYAGQEQMYLAVKSGPLLYAAYLDGFRS